MGKFDRLHVLDGTDTPQNKAVALVTWDVIVPRFFNASAVVLKHLCSPEPIAYSEWDYLSVQTKALYTGAMQARTLCYAYYDDLSRQRTVGWARHWHRWFPQRITAQQRDHWALTQAVDHLLNLTSGVHNAVEHHGFVDHPEHHTAVLIRIELESLQDALFGR